MLDYQYAVIDLKSFYASVECVERGLDPLTTNLVVADPDRTDKTICLAITPAMKKLGIKNRCRVFEIPSFVKYIMAPPRMQLYIDYSAEIYGIYLKYFAKEDIHVYSIDEAFFDYGPYNIMYGDLTSKSLSQRVMADILQTTGITATCGLGTNLYLAKIALDILAKHSPDYIGELTEETYKERLWQHRPLTDFWHIGNGTAARLSRLGAGCMESVARLPEASLYRTFGVNAEILIDHAWGREPVTMPDIKAYKPHSHSLSNGQVLPRDYYFSEALLLVKEMVDDLCLEMLERELVTWSVTLHAGYSGHVLSSAHGTVRFDRATNSLAEITAKVSDLFGRIVSHLTPVRRLYLSCNDVVKEGNVQLDLFEDRSFAERETRRRLAVSRIKRKYGKNAILLGMDLLPEARTMERNCQIGGHKSG